MILKTAGQDDFVYIEQWETSFDYRQKKMPEYETFDDFVNEWPIVNTKLGMSLVRVTSFLS